MASPRSSLQPVVLAALLTVLAGCAATPPGAAEISGPALREIQIAFAQAVEEAHRDPDASWHHGWWGNLVVNHWGWLAEHRGLCHHWQEMTYAAVLPTATAVGWELTGIVVSDATRNEHHAVLAFDPSRVAREAILTGPDVDDEVFVLDAWRRGRPDIYSLPGWLDGLTVIHTPPRLEVLPAANASATAPAGRSGPG
jgi:hypothetical protein